jgi:hypothetical protein
MLLNLPPEILEYILRYIPLSVPRIAQVCPLLYDRTARLYLELFESRPISQIEIDRYLQTFPRRLGYILVDPFEISNSRYLLRLFSRRHRGFLHRLKKKPYSYQREFGVFYVWPNQEVYYDTFRAIGQDDDISAIKNSIPYVLNRNLTIDFDVYTTWQILLQRHDCINRSSTYAQDQVWQLFLGYHQTYLQKPTSLELIKLYSRLLIAAVVLGLDPLAPETWTPSILQKNETSSMLRDSQKMGRVMIPQMYPLSQASLNQILDHTRVLSRAVATVLNKVMGEISLSLQF